MEEVKVYIEVEGEFKPDDRFALEDKIIDALRELGYEVFKVRVS